MAGTSLCLFRGSLASLLAILAAILILIPVAASAGEDPGGNEAVENSIKITVEGNEPKTNVAKGDELHRGSRVSDDPDAECDIPPVRIQMSGDVSSVRVGVDEGTCNLKVVDIVMNDTDLEDPSIPGSSFSTAVNATSGFEWYIESLAKVVGVESIDDLTKTYAHFNFKTASFTFSGSLYDGQNPNGRCWAHYDPPIYWYLIESCIGTSTDVDSTTEMH